MTTIHAIFFDLDGTLVDDNINWRQAVSQTISTVSRSCPAVSPATLETAYHSIAAEVWERIKTGGPPTWGNMEAECVVREVWGCALASLGVTDQSIYDLAISSYYEQLMDLGAPAYGDVLECLDVIRNGCRLGIITNGSEATQMAKLEGARLSKYFQCVTTTDIGFGKPHCRVFEYALECLDVEPDNAAFVGDSLEWDIRGANGAGIMSIWLNRDSVTRKRNDPLPDAEIHGLLELPSVVGVGESLN